MPGHVGPPVACCCIKLVDVPEMEYWAKNNQGEICVKGTNVFQGYYKDPAKTDETIDEQGWHHTGDVGQWLPVSLLYHFFVLIHNPLYPSIIGMPQIQILKIEK